MNRSHHRPSRRALAAGLALTLAATLAACGGGSSDDASGAGDDTTTPTELPADTSTDTGGTDAGGTDTTIAEDGTSDLDICAELTQEEMQAILTEATLVSAAPNDVIPTPSCYYNIDLTGGIQAAVIQINLIVDDRDYFEAQRDLQTDAVDVPGVEDAFAYDDFGTIMVLTPSGVFQIERGVELTEGGEAASQEQMTAIAEQVSEL